MTKVNYKITYIVIYFVIFLSFLFLINYIFNGNSQRDINNISNKQIKKEFIEHEKIFNTYFDNYKKSLIAISENSDFKNFINNNTQQKSVEELFLTMKKTLTHSRQIRFIDINGYEKIRIDDLSIDHKEQIVSEENLQNKSSRYYFNEFIKLPKETIGFSNIDLQRENGKVIIPKETTLRIGTTIFDKNNIKKGILVLNIDVKSLFDIISKTSLYNVQIVDKNRKFILHEKQNRGIESNTYDTYLLDYDYGSIEANKILSLNEYQGKNFYSKKVNTFNNNQGLILILKLRYDDLSEEKRDEEVLVYSTFIMFGLLFLPLVGYFAKTPERLRNKINKNKITDELTNLPNKEQLFIDLNKSKFKKSIIVLVNIDNYDKIQNAYGFDISDKLIQDSALFLKDIEYTGSFRKLYREGKNTFAFKFLYKDLNSLYSQIESLHYKIENNSFTLLDNFEILINCTIGISNPKNLTNSIDLLKEAEIALEKAILDKVDINIYSDDLNKTLEVNKNNITMVNNLKKAMESDNIIIEFQPIFNNKSNKIDKYETLIRMNVGGELVYPDYFLQVAKDIKKYRKLTQIVIDKSFEYFHDKDVEFSINLSIEDISNKSLRNHLFEQISKYQVQDKLVLEIVESEAISNYDNFVNFIKEIKHLGCKIAIDDFGSGYSNYEYIINLNEYIDYLKIDGTLITDIHKNPKRQLLVGTLKFLCDNLQIRTIAEYVENEELFEYIKSMGIDYSQGYYIGKSKSEIITEKL